MLDFQTRTLGLLLSFLLTLTACGDDDSQAMTGDGDMAGGAGTAGDGDMTGDGDMAGDGDAAMAVEPDYADDMFWLCHGGGEGDLCTGAELTRTVVKADATFETVEHAEADDPPLDCFFVYDTVDLRFEPGNTTDFSDLTNVIATLYGKAAWFRSVCRVFAPLYRQMTIGTYVGNFQFEETENFAMAYGDVTAAFDHYMENDNDGRKLVLIGHSQGSHMLTRLMEERFDDDPGMREMLVSAILLGPVGRVHVPPGEVVGGTFDNIPLCQAEDETGCVIAYDSEAADAEAMRLDAVEIPAGMTRACTNPAALAGGAGAFAETIWSTQTEMLFPEEATSPWVSYPAFYTGECGDNDALSVDIVADDERMPPATPQQLQTVFEMEGAFALHLVDFNYALGDLLRIVTAQTAAAGN